MTDSDLLNRFVTRRDQGAFTELVRRNLNLVYAAALRYVGGDKHRAEDVAQRVFVDLARKAPVLASHPNLAGWLYAGARFTAIDTIRAEQRRVRREQSAEMVPAAADGAEPQWDRIRPVIDDALLELAEEDRQSVLLRFFGQQTFAAIGQQLGLTENAAQKRVDRALDRLNAVLARRGITSTATVLGVALARGGVAAPTALGGAVTVAAFAAVAATGPVQIGAISVAKILAGMGVAAVGGYWGGVWHESGAFDAAVEARQLETADAMGAVEAKLAAANARWGVEKKRADAAEAETAALLNEIERARVARAAGAAPPVAPETTKAGQVYTVKRGDTGLKIAREFGLPVEALHAANVGYNFARMKVGDAMAIPAGAVQRVPAEPVPPHHVVVAGDTVLAIAATAGCSVEQLRALNPQTDWTRLKIGEVVRLR